MYADDFQHEDSVKAKTPPLSILNFLFNALEEIVGS